MFVMFFNVLRLVIDFVTLFWMLFVMYGGVLYYTFMFPFLFFTLIR